MERAYRLIFNVAACVGAIASTVYGLASGILPSALSISSSGPSAAQEFAGAAVIFSGITLFMAGCALRDRRLLDYYSLKEANRRAFGNISESVQSAPPATIPAAAIEASEEMPDGTFFFGTNPITGEPVYARLTQMPGYYEVLPPASEEAKPATLAPAAPHPGT